MRIVIGILSAALLLTAPVAAQTTYKLVPAKPDATAPHLDVVSLSAVAATSNLAPTISDLTARYSVRRPNGMTVDVVPDIHFKAPNGNAIVLHRTLVGTSGAIAQTQIRDATIAIPADAQKNGAVQSGGWTCGTTVYYATLRAFIMDSDGNKSNTVEYTIHCNGG
jgi:opacity protein-like surface antigen